MQWWTDFLDWLNSDDGWRIVSTAVIPFVAIVVAGIVAAAIGRASARKVIELSEREVRASAVTALISAARKAAVWNTLPAPEQQHIDHLIGDAEIRLRLLPIAGTALAADWSRHEIAGMKRNAISFSFQAEQSLLVFRDRLIEWQGRPSRAKKLFKNDLDSWAYDSSASEQELVHQQQKWAAQQVTETGPITTVTTTPFTRPPSPAPIQAPLVESTAPVAAGAAAAATGVTAAGLAAAAAPVAATVETEVDPPNRAVPSPAEAAADDAARLERAAAGPEVPAARLTEPKFSSPEAVISAEAAVPAEAAMLAGDEPHPLVEPADTSSHDVSEASIFGGNSPQSAAEPHSTTPDPAESAFPGSEDPEPEHTEPDHIEPSPAEAHIIDGEIVESDTEPGDASHDSGGDENVGSDDHNHGDHENTHDDHQHHEHNHDEWRG
ncbi:hypothetical protein F1C58_10300 [Glaciihabitans sp. INWT7]|uniref:hypothetical protein n=1 Tax=Glaciihabitans sp. INWT7 TaxID=2596912 RepID=UPI00162324D5|nr:hypothetical protein [Glaciihabitans sp. INWT7]QNE47250.1 hypothetical protein F1C58_10300 [Glaciihabitans sp. INWT7]